MFQEVNHLLNLNDDGLDGQFVLIADSSADGTFLLHHFLSFSLRSRRSVCFVALTQSLNHYSSVAQKLGLNLKGCRESGQLIFVEGLKLLGEAVVRGETVSKGDNPLIATAACSSLRELFLLVRDSLLQFKAAPVVVIVDNISILLTLGLPLKEVVTFCNYLYSFTCGKTGLEEKGCFIGFMNNDAEDEELLLLWKHLYHTCTLSLNVTGLKTGYCKDIHGQLTVNWRGLTFQNLRESRKKMQFKLSEKNVVFFAIGMSQAVL